MKLVNPRFEHVLILKEGITNFIAIENPEIFRYYVSELIKTSQLDEGDFVLSENNDILDFSKNVDIMTDFARFEVVDKIATNKVTSLLKSFMVSETMFDSTSTLRTQIESYALSLVELFPYPITYEHLDTSNLIKVLGLKVSSSAETLLEKIVERMSLLHDICGISIFFLINSLSYLTNGELLQLIEQANIEKHHIVFLDNIQPNISEKDIRKIIIDSDGCEIF